MIFYLIFLFKELNDVIISYRIIIEINNRSHNMSNNQINSNSGKCYKKSKFRESCEKFPAFVIVCNAAGPIKEGELL